MGKEIKPKVLIGIPVRGTTMERRLLPFIRHQEKSSNYAFIMHQCPYSAAGAQEAIFNRALDNNVDYLLMVDNDVIPPVDVLERMLARKKDILVIPVWHFDQLDKTIHLNISTNFEVPAALAFRIYAERQGLERISTSSFACILISKEVMHRFRKENETFVTWTTMLDKELLGKPSDNLFFEKARKFGFDAFVDWDIRGSIHARQIDLSTEVLAKFATNYIRSKYATVPDYSSSV